MPVKASGQGSEKSGGNQPETNRPMNTILAIYQTLRNKAVAIVLLVIAMAVYSCIPDVTFDPVTGAKAGGMPFSELLFAVILILGSVVVPPILRLLFFPEVAIYAEGGMLTAELEGPYVTNGLRHYWFATTVSFLVTLGILATIHH